MLPKQGLIKPEIISSNLSILKLYYINCNLSPETFDIPRITLIMKGGNKFFIKQETTRLSITKFFWEKIIVSELVDND